MSVLATVSEGWGGGRILTRELEKFDFHICSSIGHCTAIYFLRKEIQNNVRQCFIDALSLYFWSHKTWDHHPQRLSLGSYGFKLWLLKKYRNCPSYHTQTKYRFVLSIWSVDIMCSWCLKQWVAREFLNVIVGPLLRSVLHRSFTKDNVSGHDANVHLKAE